MSYLPVNPSCLGERHPGANGCFTMNRTDVRCRAVGLTEKGRRAVARAELSKVFGESPVERGPTPTSPDWRGSL